VRANDPGELEETELLAKRFALSVEQILYIGDDLPDLAPMRRVGISAAPSDAAPEVLAAATWKLTAGGGRGAFREMVERLLQERGEWAPLLEELGSGRPGAQSI
jgi:3-deoxy-D-manno-octulosonate 8-phosphate phosphatase (KDO 8-P phosphatase)